MNTVNFNIAIDKATNHFDTLNITDKETNIIKELFAVAYEERKVKSTSIGTRERNIVETNACISNVILKHFPFPLRIISSILGKHHSTIIHYRKLHNDCLTYDKQYIKLFSMLNDKVNDLLMEIEDDVEEHYNRDCSQEQLISELRSTILSLKVMNSNLKEKLYTIKEQGYEKRNTPCNSIL